MLKPGDRLDRYVLESFLAEGGMGAVFVARDDRLDRRVAVKALRTEASASPEQHQRLLREARAVAALHHPGIVSIFDVGEHEGAPYLVMELVDGVTLRKAPTRGWRERLGWLVDIARALDAAHTAGLVHRDIKPDNVMVRRDGVIKILDFGIARATRTAVDPLAHTQANGLGTLTTEGVQIGTPLYMAPEQIRNESLDGRCDQFAWGVLAYELLGGRVPWNGVDTLAVVASILTESPPPLDSLAADLPPPVAAVITRALAKRAADRFATMGEVVAALSPWLHAAPDPDDARTAQAPPSGSSPASGASGRQPSSGSSGRASPASAAPAYTPTEHLPPLPGGSPVSPTLAGRAFSDAEARAILDRAFELPDSGDSRLRYEDLLAAAREVGLSERVLEEAARDFEERQKQRRDETERARRRRLGFWRHAGIFAIVIVGLLGLTPLRAVQAVFFSWGIGLAIHALSVFMPRDARRDARRDSRRQRQRDLRDQWRRKVWEQREEFGKQAMAEMRALRDEKDAEKTKEDPAAEVPRLRVAEGVSLLRSTAQHRLRVEPRASDDEALLDESEAAEQARKTPGRGRR